MNEILIQGLGFIAAGMSIASVCQTNDKKLLFLAFIALFLWAVHFWFLGAIAAAVMDAIVAFRCLISVKYKSPALGILFSFIVAVVGFYTFTGYISLLPIISSIIGSLGTTCLNGIPMRFSLLICTLLWLANNILVGSYGGILLETIDSILYLVTIYRLQKDKYSYV